eukprot:ANDGO_00313.mRNA.1 hypothetical protein
MTDSQDSGSYDSSTDIDSLRLHLQVYNAVNRSFQNSLNHVQVPESQPQPQFQNERDIQYQYQYQNQNQASNQFSYQHPNDGRIPREFEPIHHGRIETPPPRPFVELRGRPSHSDDPAILVQTKLDEQASKEKHDAELSEVREKLITEKMAFQSWESNAHHKLDSVELKLKTLDTRLQQETEQHNSALQNLKESRGQLEHDIVHSIEESMQEIKRQADMQSSIDVSTSAALVRIEESRKKLEQLKQDQEILEQRLRTSEQDAMDERSLRRKAVDRAEELQEQFARVAAQYERAYAGLVRENEHLQRQVRDLQEEIAHFNKTRAHPHRVEAVLRSKIAELRTELHAEAERSASAEMRAKMSEASAKQSKKFGHMEGARKVLEEEVRSLRALLQSETKKKFEAESRVERLEAENRKLRLRFETDFGAVASVKDSLEEEVGDLRKEYEMARRELSESRVVFEKQRQVYSQERAACDAQLAELEQALRTEREKRIVAERSSEKVRAAASGLAEDVLSQENGAKENATSVSSAPAPVNRPDHPSASPLADYYPRTAELSGRTIRSSYWNDQAQESSQPVPAKARSSSRGAAIDLEGLPRTSPPGARSFRDRSPSPPVALRRPPTSARTVSPYSSPRSSSFRPSPPSSPLVRGSPRSRTASAKKVKSSSAARASPSRTNSRAAYDDDPYSYSLYDDTSGRSSLEAKRYAATAFRS